MDREYRNGILLGILAFTFWGTIPIYFKAVSAVSPTEVLAHRVLWSSLLLLTLLVLRGHLLEFIALLRQQKLILWLFIAALLVSTNWLIFIWAITNGMILDASMGYFINPLFSLLLGMIFLAERLRLLQWFAILFAIIGVAYKIVMVGSLPWVALALATTFGLYGLIRKKIQADPIQGLAVETLLLSPIAIIYLLWLSHNQQLSFFNLSWELDLLLIAAGVVTSIPLVAFAGATNKLPLSTLAFLQYISPSLNFILAIFIYDEPFGRGELITFLFIWLALLIFTYEGVIYQRQVRRKVVEVDLF